MTAPGTVTVTVTAEHIAKGRRQDCERCPVALALADAFPDAAGIAASAEAFSMNTGTDVIIDIALPFEVEDFVCAFDAGLPVEPFSFTVDRPAVTP